MSAVGALAALAALALLLAWWRRPPGGPSAARTRPAHVGVLAMAIYVPPGRVRQADLERRDGVAAGKYTVGLGQDSMAVASDRDDVASMALTAVARLLERAGVAPAEVGRLEVGTETLVDKCKSVKTLLMQLFEASGNADVEGVTTINACYGGTAALFNSAAWVESSAWDGRFAVVVASDVAVYAPGPARPTGGAGAVAMLVGPGAPLALDALRTTHSQNTWDFFKPRLASEYPQVDGPSSLACYLGALDSCYERFVGRGGARFGAADHALFHAPYHRLVRKAALRLLWHDLRAEGVGPALERWAGADPADHVNDRALYAALEAVPGGAAAMARVADGARLGKAIGNCYTASLYAGLASLVAARGEGLRGARVLLFSYGSGAIGSLFTLAGRASPEDPRFSLEKMAAALDVDGELAAARFMAPEEFERRLDARERNAAREPPFAPAGSLAEDVVAGAYYLARVGEGGVREYSRR